MTAFVVEEFGMADARDLLLPLMEVPFPDKEVWMDLERIGTSTFKKTVLDENTPKEAARNAQCSNIGHLALDIYTTVRVKRGFGTVPSSQTMLACRLGQLHSEDFNSKELP